MSNQKSSASSSAQSPGVITAIRKTSLAAKLQRKDPGLPVFIVIPGELIAAWDLKGTSIVEGTANGHPFGRRTIKAWGKGVDAWFVEFTAPLCKAAGLAVGEPVALQLWLADTSIPDELDRLLTTSEALSRAWWKLTDGKRREASEHIRAAKSSATRESRASAVVSKLRSQPSGS